MRVGYVCRAGGRFGWGHVHRGLALLERLDARSELVVGSGFAEVKQSKHSFSARAWLSEEEPVDPGDFDVIIADDYDLPFEWLESTSERVCTYVVDDWMRTKVHVTGFINPNIGALRSDYTFIEARQLLLGSAYAFMRSEVREIAVTPRRRRFDNHLLVTLGGSDPEGRTAEVVDALSGTAWFRAGGRITAVLGASYTARIPAVGHTPERLSVVRNPEDYLRRCREADLVICSASTVSYEMALMGVPFIPLAFVDNQRMILERWADAGVGRRFDTAGNGWATALTEFATEAVACGDVLDTMTEKSNRFVDGQGTARIVAACREACGVGR